MNTRFQLLRRPRGRAGNAMLESALCFLLFMTIFLGIIEFGMGIFTYNFVSYAAREGSRYASVRGSQSGYTAATTETNVRTAVRNQVVALDSTQLTVDTVWNSGNNYPGNTVTVNVSYPLTPVLGWLLGNITVSATSTMMIAQ